MFLIALTVCISIGFSSPVSSGKYTEGYHIRLGALKTEASRLEDMIRAGDPTSATGADALLQQINRTRVAIKRTDFWLRYLDPNLYRNINAPLPVEWETEVFEKFEKPYRRIGAGLTLAATYLKEGNVNRDSLLWLVQQTLEAIDRYRKDSIVSTLQSHHQFFLCNRLFLLNLAAIYTTGFECPDTSRIIPELQIMLENVDTIYASYQIDFPSYALSDDYTSLYQKAVAFVSKQPHEYSRFDHYTWIRDYVNPLFGMNQAMIRQYKVKSRSVNDYTLNTTSNSIFSKQLFYGQNQKGIFSRVSDPTLIEEIRETGKLLFFDPLLSGNNQRSCASCHKPDQAFTDTTRRTASDFEGTASLPRNTPSLLNVKYNHLLMADGKHTTLQKQGRAVVSNPEEMHAIPEEVVNKVMDCKQYQKAFKKFLAYTPQEKVVTFEHIISAITLYYGRFSEYDAPFDQAMNGKTAASDGVREGFNLFMSRAQCATCHFIPQFNGVKPPYVSSEFEVLGVPADTSYRSLSSDSGRYDIHPVDEMLFAFRTTTLRNTGKTPPYMHNGVFNSLEQVIDFYNAGGGAGHHLQVPNQTLPSDSLRLSVRDKQLLTTFILSLNEDIPTETIPEQLPVSGNKTLNTRKTSGTY
ncbi:MAG: cytochrome C peroxidase [Flavobacteriales bacterium]|nr:cytochrome C peroxidase [Flavobacteriales bacterium]